MDHTFIYEIRTPAKEEPGRKYPAIFMMHGMGSNEQDMLGLVSGMEQNAYIFSIRGHLEHPPGFSYFTIEGFGKPHQSIFFDTIQKLEAFIGNALNEYAIDPEKVFVGGFSQGAILSMTLSLTMGNKIKGVMAFNGYIPQFIKDEYSKQQKSNLKLFISHGETDPVFPLAWGEANRNYFQKLGATVTYHAYPAGHTISLENYNDFRAWIEQQKN